MLHEGALGVDDMLDRRVRLGVVPAERRRAEAVAVQLLEGSPRDPARPAAAALVGMG